MSQRAGSVVTEVAASHSVYISQPAAVADLIGQAAAPVAVWCRAGPCSTAMPDASCLAAEHLIDAHAPRAAASANASLSLIARQTRQRCSAGTTLTT